jgi:hypothetical protein
MLRKMAIAATFFVGTVCVPGQPPKPASGQTTQPANPRQTPAVVTAIPGKETCGDASKSKQPSGYQWHELLSPANIPNWGLVLVGAVAGCFAWLTLQDIRRQVGVAEANTQAMIRAERAWIVVRVECQPEGGFNFWMKNEGKTPAKVASIWSTNLFLDRTETLVVPTDEETSESLLSSPPCLVPPGAERIIWRCSKEDFERASGGGTGEQSRFYRGFGSGDLYGRIRYFNVLDTDPKLSHETRWLYWVIPVKDALPFPDPRHNEYNSYT